MTFFCNKIEMIRIVAVPVTFNTLIQFTLIFITFFGIILVIYVIDDAFS